MPSALQLIIIIVVSLTVVIALRHLFAWALKKEDIVWRDTLLNWAKKNGYHLLEVKLVGTSGGTRGIRRGKYRIVVGTDGGQRTALVKVTDLYVADKASNVEVYWDDTPAHS